ncbi:right-handed parallel beta-helix repeat-containing protein [Prochlorococcus marinus]|uniref:right-handed parallel beta-helix repeat-containing protein n=1 Tax=Prochlorococcus marinus TaxID=1219 RepID=UPI0022B3A061|nr:right-handed parallel beta-helix repeat-containing protein [Prochlorococcus marinus]
MLVFEKKIKNNTRSLRILDYLSKINRKSIFLKTLIGFTSIGIILIPLDFGKPSNPNISNIISKTLNKIDTRIGYLGNETYLFGGNLLSIGTNYIKSFIIKQNDIRLNISIKNLNKIKNIRNKAIKDGILIRSDDDQVNGSISYKGTNYPIELRLKGDWTDHLLGDKWSFRIQTKKDTSFEGMYEFSLQHPRTRNYINEYVFHKLLKYENLPYLRYDFKPFYLNGKYLGVYAIEEHFGKAVIENSKFREGPIIKLSDQDLRNERQRMLEIDNSRFNYFTVNQNNSDIDTFNQNKISTNPQQISQYNLAKDLFNDFLKNKYKSSDVFDLELTAKYFALLDLLQAGKANTWYDMRFYFNPIIARLLPIGYDAQYPIRTQQRILSSDLNTLNIFNDPLFVKEYISNLQRLTSPGYLENFLDYINKDLKVTLTKIHRSYPHVKFLNSELYKNRKYILTRLTPDKPIGLVLNSPINGNNILDLELYNKTTLPLNIKSLEYNGIHYYPSAQEILEPLDRFNRLRSRNIKFISKNSNYPSANSLSNNLINIKYNLIGSTSIQTISLKTLPFSNQTTPTNYLVRRRTNIKDFEFLKVDKKAKEITIGTSVVIDKPLIMPTNYKLKILKGVSITLKNNALILIQGPLFLQGSRDLPIYINNDSTGKGLIVINANSRSVITHSFFNSLSEPSIASINITGGLTFYNSPVTIEDSTFSQASSEDSLNLVRSPFLINNTKFIGSASDAIDIDFSNGTISNSSFSNTGNDSIDISGADVTLNNISIISSGDKAISVGEEGNVIANNIKVSDSFIGIASKDLSNVKISNISINNVEFCLTAYKKKPEYGPASIKLLSNSSTCHSKYLLEPGSTISSKYNIFIPNSINVYNQLYIKEDINGSK